VATTGIETVEKLCEAFRSARSVEEEDENEQVMVPSFAKTYKGLQKVKAFFYMQSGSNMDHENILSLEKLYFQLRQNSVKEQRTMYNFFLLKSSFFNVVYIVSQINRFPTFIVSFLHPLEKQ
jgi:hypothetical protein